jgi:hypothetical protein
MAVRLTEIFHRVSVLRDDALPGSVEGALLEAAIKVARDTGVLKDTIPFTIQENEWNVLLELPAGRKIRSIEAVWFWEEDLEKWLKLDRDLKLYQEAKPQAPETNETQEPYVWCSKLDNYVYFECPSNSQYGLRADITWVPGRESVPDEIEFPDRFEDALVAYSKYLLFEIDGKGQNLSKSQTYLASYKNELPGLCHMAMEGSGVVRMMNDWLPQE